MGIEKYKQMHKGVFAVISRENTAAPPNLGSTLFFVIIPAAFLSIYFEKFVDFIREKW
jgi:hypothetical protein